MNKIKKVFIGIGTLCILCGGFFIYHTIQKQKESTHLIELTEKEKEQFSQLEKVKIVTKEQIHGVFSKEAFKVTGYEETGLKSKQAIQDELYQRMIDEDDTYLVEKGKEFLNELNKRELYADFVVDYGLGFDLSTIVDKIKVNEETGEVNIPTPELTFTNFYIDPTFTIEENNGLIVELFNRTYTTEEKHLLIKKMEETIQTNILEDDNTKETAMLATKKQLTTLIQQIHPDIKVIFK